MIENNRVDTLAGVSNKATFCGSIQEKMLAIRTDSEKDICRLKFLTVSGLNRKDIFKRFKESCILRQEGKVKYNNGNAAIYDCQNCACGIEIMTGKRKKLPANVKGVVCKRLGKPWVKS